MCVWITVGVRSDVPLPLHIRAAVVATGRWCPEVYGPKCQCFSSSMSRFSFCVMWGSGGRFRSEVPEGGVAWRSNGRRCVDWWDGRRGGVWESDTQPAGRERLRRGAAQPRHWRLLWLTLTTPQTYLSTYLFTCDNCFTWSFNPLCHSS